MIEIPAGIFLAMFCSIAFLVMFVFILHSDVKMLKEDVYRIQREVWQAELKSIRDRGKQ